MNASDFELGNNSIDSTAPHRKTESHESADTSTGTASKEGTASFGIPSSMTGDELSTQIPENTRWHPDDRVEVRGYDTRWNTGMRGYTIVKACSGGIRYRVVLHVQVYENKPAIKWYLEFKVLKKRMPETDARTQTGDEGSTLSVEANATGKEPSTVAGTVKWNDLEETITATCDNVLDLWEISENAAKDWSSKQGTAQVFASKFLQVELADSESDIFLTELIYLVEGVCAKGRELQRRVARFVGDCDRSPRGSERNLKDVL